MANPFEYRTPSAEQIETMQTIAGKLGELYLFVQLSVPRSSERTLAVRKLQEARSWLNAALVMHDQADDRAELAA